MEETYKNVSENYWWEGMFPDIRDYVQGCSQCKDRRDNPQISEEKYITRKLTSHCTKVLERLNSQRSKGVFCDVTLIVEETSYPAHRAVLAAVSEYFQDLFSEKGCTSNKIVHLKGFSNKSFLPLLEFSYTSSLSVKPDYFAETSALARHLRIWEVVEMCAALCKLHGTGNSKTHEASKEEKKEFSSYEVCIDQSLTGRTQQVSDIYYRFGQLEDGPAQQKLDNFGRNVFSPRSHSPVIQGETKGPDFTFKLQEMQSGHFKDKMASAYSESSIGSLGVETLENSSRKFKLLGFYDKTRSKMLKVKSVSPQSCSSANKSLSDIPTTFELKFADKSRNIYNQRKCNLEKTIMNSKSYTRVSKHLDHNIAGPQDNSSCKGANTLRSPVRQMATEEELYSPNTTEKYKLLSVLGLQRKTSVTDGEEQASWKQKRRLRQPKNLLGAAQILKKVQPNFKETLKLTPRRKYIAVESMKTTKVSRAHRCYECSATFTNCDSLFMHRIKHTKGKRWPCLLCDKSFYCLKNVQVHLRSHREKLYRCKLCVTVSKKAKPFQSKW